MFYGAPCWASVLCSIVRLAELDSVLAYAAWMAFRLESTTSVEAALVLAGLEPSRCHILRLLTRYIVRRHRETLRDFFSGEMRGSRVTPLELGCTWFRRSVWGKTLLTPLARRRQTIYQGIDRALRAEWQRRWRESETGGALREALPRVGGAWMTRDTQRGSRVDPLMAARYLTGHCHIGAFDLSWYTEEWVACPWCGDEFSRDHMLWECRGLTEERHVLLRGIGSDRRGNLEWLASHFGSRIGRFTRAAGQLVERVVVSADGDGDAG